MSRRMYIMIHVEKKPVFGNRELTDKDKEL
jgi:hypothetical protein